MKIIIIIIIKDNDNKVLLDFLECVQWFLEVFFEDSLFFISFGRFCKFFHFCFIFWIFLKVLNGKFWKT